MYLISIELIVYYIMLIWYYKILLYYDVYYVYQNRNGHTAIIFFF